MERHEGFDPVAAWEQAQSMAATVRRRGRWHGWVWLTLGLATPVFLVVAVTDVAAGAARTAIAIAFALLAGLLAVWETKRGLWGRQAARVDRTATTAYVVAMAVAAAAAVAGDVADAPAWYLVLAVLPSVPCFVAAWRTLSE